MKKITVLLFASLFSFLMLPFAHADQGVSLSDLHQKVMGYWKLDSINGGVPIGYPNLGISDVQIYGSTGCNSMFGVLLALSEDNLQHGGLASTRMLCDEARNDQENRFMQAFEQTTVLSYDEDTEELTIGSEENTLNYTKAKKHSI